MNKTTKTKKSADKSNDELSFIELEERIISFLLFGQALYDHNCYGDVSVVYLEALEPNDFGDETLRTIFKEIQEVYKGEATLKFKEELPKIENPNKKILRTSYNQNNVDHTLVVYNLRARGEVEAEQRIRTIGLKVDNYVGFASTGAEYIRRMKKSAHLRKVKEESQKLIESLTLGSDPAELLNEFYKNTEKVFLDDTGMREVDTSKRLNGLVDDILDRKNQKKKFVPTGFEGLDYLVIGAMPNELIIVAARPSMGKTAFALNIASNITKNETVDKPVFIFSLEMSADALLERIISSETGIPLAEIKKGEFSNYETKEDILHKMLRFIGENANKLIIDDTPSSIDDIEKKTRLFARKYGDPALVTIDYLDLIEDSPSVAKSNYKPPLHERTSEKTKRLKALAKKMKIPVCLLAQLNRNVESRRERFPQLSDLRNSGAIEQDADKIIFIHRDDMTVKNIAEKNGLSNILVSKNRDGKTGDVVMKYDGEHLRFHSLSDMDMRYFEDKAKQKELKENNFDFDMNDVF